MGRREPDQEEASDAPGAGDDIGTMLVVTGWVLIVGALVWTWMVFFAHQPEVGLWVAAAIGGLGYLLQRAGNHAA